MRHAANAVLVALGPLAVAWALTMLTPAPQGLVVGVVAAALAVERRAPPRARLVTFVFVVSLASLLVRSAVAVAGGRAKFTVCTWGAEQTVDQPVPAVCQNFYGYISSSAT